MWLITMVPLMLFIVNLYIWVYIFAEKRKNAVDKAFLIYAGAMVLLTLLDFLMISPINRVTAEIAIRVFGFIDPLANFLLLNFVFKLLNKRADRLYGIALVFSFSIGILTTFTGLVFLEFDIIDGGVVISVSETLPPLFALGRLLPVIYSFFLLFRHFKKIKTAELKRPLKILISGLAVSFFAIIFFNGIIGHVIRWHSKYNIEMYSLLIRSFVLTLELVLIFILGKKYRFLSIGIKDISYEVFESIRDALLVVNPDGTIIHANKNACLLFKIPMAEIIGLRISILFNDCDNLSKAEYSEISVMIGEDKLVLDIYISPIKYGNVEMGDMLILRDMTAERNTEKELKESREDLNLKSLVFDNTSNALFVTNLEGKIVHWNSGAENTFGFTKDEVIGRHPDNLFFTKSTDYYCFDGIFEKVLKGEKFRREVTTHTKKGNSIILDELILPLYDTDNNSVGGLTIALDITERKRIEEDREKLINKLAETNEELERSNAELEKTNEELVRLSKMKDDFLTIASHDLRAPFNAILGASEILIYDTSLSDRQRQFIEMISTSAQNQLLYVDDILEILRFESVGLKINKENALLKTIIQNSVSILQVLALKKNIQIETDIDCNRIIEVDIPKFTQVINNLLSNAIKFTHENGRILIQSCDNDNGELEIHVIDNGIGIPENKINSLFKSYQQAHQSGTAGEKGTGLGLTICKKMIEAHGGNIFVKNNEGNGTDFFFTIPIKTKNQLEKV